MTSMAWDLAGLNVKLKAATEVVLTQETHTVYLAVAQ